MSVPYLFAKDVTAVQVRFGLQARKSLKTFPLDGLSVADRPVVTRTGPWPRRSPAIQLL
ncbi:hypothetical protein A8926_0141 [Saccharopolyspora spinosa]|uniref:Uncharacterized protein n=1 Tax=Saccharopolyspora spinosa TaxID=60894 RepID=A0A2N3XPQ1_SACSN|nr:hypothetical protein A8926_0141 [Saccharopolyspora spinosa]